MTTWMRLALAEAARGSGAVEPNPMVGAVVVREGRLVGVGHHDAVRRAARRGRRPRGGRRGRPRSDGLRHPRTLLPPRQDAALHRRPDPSRGRPGRRGDARPVPEGRRRRLRPAEEAGVEVEVGLLGDEARRLNAPYLKRWRPGRPYVIAKWAMTLDGKIAARTGREPMDLRPPVARPRPRGPRAGWTRSSSGSGRRSPTTRG